MAKDEGSLSEVVQKKAWEDEDQPRRDDWLAPELFRFGASTLLNDVLMQIVKTTEGGYRSSDYFALS